MRVACLGDVHGSIDSLVKLYQMLEHETLDDIYHLGDLIDRGPDTAGVLRFCMEKRLKGVMGNHEGALISKHIEGGNPPKNPDKLRSYNAVLSTDGALEYLKALPNIVVLEELSAILVHAGVDPLKPLAAQNRMCSYVSMVNPAAPGTSRWWGVDRRGRHENQNRAEGWVRWYELYNEPYDVFHGHIVYEKPHVSTLPNGRRRFGVDTGAHWTGMLTAAIIGPNGFEKFVSTEKTREGSFYEINLA